MTWLPGLIRLLGRALAGLAAAGVLLAGVPYALLRLAGSPLPHRLPAWPQVRGFLASPLSDGAIIHGLADVGWVLWALLALCVLIEAAAAATGRPAPRLPGLGPLQALAASLLGATLITTLPAGLAGASTAAALPAGQAARTVTASPLRPSQPASTAAGPAAAPAAGASHQAAGRYRPRTYRVVAGDDLWSIAEHCLGSGEQWRRLYHLNKGKPQPGGGALTSPQLIYPGWVLLLPPPAQHHEPAAPARPPHHHHPGQPARHSPPPVPPGPAPGRPAPSPHHPPSPHHQPAHDRHEGLPVAVHLPSGSLIGISVAVAVAAGLVLARIQRRRRYRPGLAASVPGEPPLPEVITALRRAARPALPADGQPAGGSWTDPDPYGDPYADDDPGPGPAGELDSGSRAPHLPGTGRPADPAAHGTADSPDGPAGSGGPGPAQPAAGPRPAGEVAGGSPGPPSDGTASPRGPASAGPAARLPAAPPQAASHPAPAAGQQHRPGVLPLGVRDTSETLLDVAAAGGLGLTGPGAPAATRAILASLLAESPPGQPGLPTDIIIPAADAASLLPGQDITGLPGLLIPATLAAALEALEAAVLRQARITGTHTPGDNLDPGSDSGDGDGDGDGDGGQDTAPGGVAGPATVLIAACDASAVPRLGGIAQAARDLGVAAVVLGPWPPGITCQVAADGVLAGLTPPDPRLDGVRLYGLDAGEAAAIIAVLREAHGAPPPAAPAVAGEPAVAGLYLPAPVAASPPAPAAEPSPPPARSPAATPGRADSPAATAPDEAPPGTVPPVTVNVLGPVRVTAAGEEIGGGLRKARELLAFLAVHRDGASGEAISEALWPGASPGQALSQRQAAVRKARRLLRTATGLPGPMWVSLAGDRYRLDPAVISTDLWQFQDALEAARRASQDEEARLAAFRAAASLYQGELAEGAGYDWAEPYAEQIRRQALDAWTGIADILQARDPGQALAALETALGHDPYNEFLYQRIMRLQADAGHPEAVRRTLALLEARLAELGVSAGAQTREVAAVLLGPAGSASFPPAQQPPRPLTAPQRPQRRAG